MTVPRYESKLTDPSPLGKPLKFEFSGREAKNRFLKAAMTERLATWDPKDLSKRGVPTQELFNVYQRWGEGNFGMILTGNLMIEKDHLEAPGNHIISRDDAPHGERFEAFKTMGALAKKHGSLVVGQLSHPGRQVSDKIQEHPISASDIHLEGEKLGFTFAKPTPMSHDRIKSVIEAFAHAADYLNKAGYDGIQLHGAHGYLISQFLSKTTNKRTDEYGGSLENRARIILEMIDAIKKVVPKTFIIGLKLNSVEFQQSGTQPEETKHLCELLEKAGVDFVELSGGTYQETAWKKRDDMKAKESFFLDFAEQITPSLTKTKTYITGGFKSLEGIIPALKTVDGIGLARAVCQEFDLPAKLLDGKVTASMKQLGDQDDFAFTNFIAGTQIRNVSHNQAPIDMTKQENLEGIQKDMKAFMDAMGKDKEGKMSGYMDVHSVKNVPYGS